MSYALYELALHPEIQNRLRAEIMQVLNKHNGEVTYDGLQEMAYHAKNPHSVKQDIISTYSTYSCYIITIVMHCISFTFYIQKMFVALQAL
jgi:hypothetical protein